MNHPMMSSTGIDQDSHLAHDNSYPSNQWGEVNNFAHMTTMTSSYPDTYYMAHANHHGLPSESIGGHMAPPPVPHQHMHHHNIYPSQLPSPLIIPTQHAPPPVQWPSMHTNPPQHSYSTPPVAIPPASAPVRQHPRLPTINTSQPRRTLTDEDRRNMCKFHEENPTVKQAEIGIKFGVERSTVSKVLRKKDQYLNADDRSGSPFKKNKGKSPPDIERALANWVRGQQKKGVLVNDDDMEEKAKVFCTGSDSPLKNINASWIEKFKQKHGFLPGKLTRRASETAIPDSTRLDRLERLDTESPLLSASQTPGGISPASPAGQLVSPRTSSTNLKGEGKEAGSGSGSGSGFAMFGESSYRHPHSQSTTSLSSAVTDPPSSTLSAGAFSPTSQFTFSPDPNTGLFNGLPGSSNFQRPRSQTVPNIEPLEYLNQSQGSEPLTPKYSTSGTAPSSALESPAHELPAPPFGLDSAISPPALHHASSNGSLAGRSTTSGAVSAMGSTPGSPTQEDARRAADTLLSFMQHQSSGWVDQNDYMIFVRLTEKLGIAQQQHGIPKVSSSSQGLGTLSRIPEGDTEMTNASPPLLRNAADMRA